MLCMTNQLEINLGTDWLYHFTTNTSADFSKTEIKETGWIPLPQLSDWSVSKTGQGGTDWFRRRIVLQPTDGCVRYFLRIERVPESVVVYVNGTKVDAAGGGDPKPFYKDITDYVALGTNILALRLSYSSDKSGGSFGKVTLVQTDCEITQEGDTRTSE